VVICLERGADLHMAQLMPLPLTVSCSCKIQIGFTFLVLAHLGSPGQRVIKRVCVCVCACVRACVRAYSFYCKQSGACCVLKPTWPSTLGGMEMEMEVLSLMHSGSWLLRRELKSKECSI